MIDKILGLSRSNKQAIAICADIGILIFSIYLSLWVTSNYLPGFRQVELVLISTTVIFTIFSSYILGVYRTVHRFLAYKTFLNIAVAVLLGSSIVYLASEMLGIVRLFATTITFWTFTTLLSTGVRLLVRQLIIQKTSVAKERVIIYGAGDGGVQLVAALARGKEYHPVAFVDDKKALHGTTIEGLPVFHSSKIQILFRKYSSSILLLAIPSASHSRRKEIVDFLEPFSAEIKTMPGMADIISGKAKIDELQDVDIEDLLGRETVPAEPELLEKCISDKVVMVSGAGGSIGSELCRQIIQLQPKTLILYEICEFSLYKIEQTLQKLAHQIKSNINIIPILGSVQNRSRLKSTLNTYKINTVYHAAAYKHVPLVEHNTIEGIRNNIYGTLNFAQASAEANVETFVLISTDKAVRPTNTMGASKRMAELVLQGLTAVHPNTTFCMVRFGNVLGSSGSVVPLFRDQIRNGGPITVTHPRIIRYFMTIPEAALLVIQAGSMANGGDVFVLDMGKPVLITDLAKKMIRLSGMEVKDDENPNGDIGIEFTGLRPGEKLYEELIIGDGNVTDTNHTRIMRAKESFLGWTKLKELLHELDEACSHQNQELIRDLLIKAPTGFNPSSEICDAIYLEENKETEDNIIKLA